MRDNAYRVDVAFILLVSAVVVPLETWRRWGELLSPAAVDDAVIVAAALVVARLLARRSPAAPALWVFVCGGAWFLMFLSVWGSLYFAAKGDPSGVPVGLVVVFKVAVFSLISVASWRAVTRVQQPDPYAPR